MAWLTEGDVREIMTPEEFEELARKADALEPGSLERAMLKMNEIAMVSDVKGYRRRTPGVILQVVPNCAFLS